MLDCRGIPFAGFCSRPRQFAKLAEKNRPGCRRCLSREKNISDRKNWGAESFKNEDANRMRLLCTVLLLFFAIGAASASPAGEFVPLPSFNTYENPNTQTPVPKAELREYLDVGALFAGLSLATYLALVKRSRNGLFLLTIASLAWLGFWGKGCICPIGAIGNVTLAACDPSYIVPLSAVAIFILPLIFTLFFGRTFCAAVCPLGAVQELVAIRPVQTPVWLDHTLGLLAYVYLGAAVLFAATGTG